jgi:glycosidase
MLCLIIFLINIFGSKKHLKPEEVLLNELAFISMNPMLMEHRPNNWISLFGGPSWTQVEDGQFYLHLFDPSQPDLNWENPEVLPVTTKLTLRFWLDLGVDGFRIDVAHGLSKREFVNVDHPDPQGISDALAS